jgi:hypothetical protein
MIKVGSVVWLPRKRTASGVGIVADVIEVIFVPYGYDKVVVQYWAISHHKTRQWIQQTKTYRIDRVVELKEDPRVPV